MSIGDRPRALLCVFAHASPLLLVNLLRSVERFFPELDVLVLDDGTPAAALEAATVRARRGDRLRVLANNLRAGDERQAFRLDQAWLAVWDPGLPFTSSDRERLARLLHDGAWRASRHGFFYLHQLLALRLALAGGYDLAWFVEGDMQMVRADPELCSRLARLFERESSVVEIAVQFLLRPARYAWRVLPELGVYQPDRAYNTNGVFNLERLRARPELVNAIAWDLAAGNLRETSYRWSQLGARCWFDALPVQCHVPWPHLFRRPRPPRVTDLCVELAVDPEAFVRRELDVPPLFEYFVRPTFRPYLPGPPYWYNHLFVGRYLELCREAQARADGRPVRWPPSDAAKPLPHYWAPDASGTPAAFAAGPGRLRRAIMRLLAPFRLLALAIAYLRFMRTVRAEVSIVRRRLSGSR